MIDMIRQLEYRADGDEFIYRDVYMEIFSQK